ncbi:MAG: hypothetical protein JWQ30_1945 [Sediminibacterium sp.]|nr:hypothetical protein [Sediminibacterium sp.]
MWNNNEIRLTPESEFIFFNKDANEGSPPRINFKSDSTGSIGQFSMGNNDIWGKAKDYKPVVKVEIAHTPEQLKPFEGLFQAQNGQQRSPCDHRDQLASDQRYGVHQLFVSQPRVIHLEREPVNAT